MEITRLSHEVFKSEGSDNEQFAVDVLTGLCSEPKGISAKYFYDDLGSEIFQKITQHEDYYPTRTEFKILDEIKSKVAQTIEGDEVNIIELGAGDGHKSQLIIDGFLSEGKKVNFYPIDISEKAMYLLNDNMKAHHNLKIHGVVGEYFEGLRFVQTQSSLPSLVLFLGSNIGNFNRVQNQGFLRQLWKNLGKNEKHPEKERAY